MLEYSRTTQDAWGTIGAAEEPVVVDTETPFGHRVVTERFVDAILDGTPLVANGAEGVASVTLANAIMMSSLTGQSITLPMDGDQYEALLAHQIRASGGEVSP